MESKSHWEHVYTSKRPTEVSWYRPHLDVSLELVQRAAPNRDACIIDVGGGEATLVDDLLDLGYVDVAVLDIAESALQVARRRLGPLAAKVTWMCGDVTTFSFSSHRYDVWHDRAVFHFLTNVESRAAYVRQVAHAVKPGGHVIVATFGPEGPTSCSGLNVERYDAEALHRQFGRPFRLVDHRTEVHRTPSGASQQFVYCFCRMA